MAPNDAIHFESVIDRFVHQNGMHFIDVPDGVAQLFVSTTSVRMMCLLNGKVEFHCALRPKGNGTFYISVGTPIRQQLKIRSGDKIQAAIWKDDSEYGRKMPEELQELLAIDEEGNRCFQALKSSDQRAIMYYVDGAKNSQIRIDRAIKMIDRFKKK
ncbi:YdeI/OmpD-associated family protein [Larkinella rosea]|uniref:DUF1905 domain-containing protein n=1 Tax=Larkinella rosea TaxID=2025312 RepID=A0A3P1C1W8_9BACT|nr:YdeI/OmpD-associated family protein [Larkinella rosea]RRB07375.1 DUF1905 domain-containing protein [Larkinella rosea]